MNRSGRPSQSKSRSNAQWRISGHPCDQLGRSIHSELSRSNTRMRLPSRSNMNRSSSPSPSISMGDHWGARNPPAKGWGIVSSSNDTWGPVCSDQFHGDWAWVVQVNAAQKKNIAAENLNWVLRKNGFIRVAWFCSVN